jgi:hypothetical protein
MKQTDRDTRKPSTDKSGAGGQANKSASPKSDDKAKKASNDGGSKRSPVAASTK